MKLLVIFCVSLSLPTYSDYTNLGWNTDEYEDDDSHFLLSREKRGAPGEVVTKAQKTLYDQIPTLAKKCGCQDLDPGCPEWAAKVNGSDKCVRNTDEWEWMRVNCMKSCGDCDSIEVSTARPGYDEVKCYDEKPDCCISAHVDSMGCGVSSSYTSLNSTCRYSCNACENNPTPTKMQQIPYLTEKCGCVDNDPSCAKWAKNTTNCATDKSWTRVYCRKSCGDCQVSDDSLSSNVLTQESNDDDNSCVDVNSKCCIWANAQPSECDVNSAWMSSACAFSCRTCDTKISWKKQMPNILDQCGCMDDIDTCGAFVKGVWNS